MSGPGGRRSSPAPLSVRELQVLGWLACDWPLATIAAELGLSPHTVKTHRRRILLFFGALSTGQAVRAAERAGLLSLEPVR